MIIPWPLNVYGWHFTNGPHLRDGQELIAGKTYNVEGKIVPCQHGLHASVRALHALSYAGGTTASYVVLSGSVYRIDNEKHCASVRTVLTCGDVADVVFEFGRFCAERTIRRIPEPSQGYLNALECARLFMHSEITIDEVEAAAHRMLPSWCGESAVQSMVASMIYRAKNPTSVSAGGGLVSAAQWASQCTLGGPLAGTATEFNMLDRMLTTMLLAKLQEQSNS